MSSLNRETIISWGKQHRLKIILAGLVMLVVLVLLLCVPGVDKDRVLDFVKKLPTGTFLVAFLILPLFGAPISIFLIVAAVKFGLMRGSCAAAGCMLFHNIAAYWFTHTFLKHRITAFLARVGYKIPHVPDQHQLWFTAAFTGMPGIPYTPKLYLLALTNVPFRFYLGVGWPVYSLSNVVYLGLAGAALAVNWPLIAGLLGLSAVAVGVSYWLKKRLDRQVRREARNANGHAPE